MKKGFFFYLLLCCSFVVFTGMHPRQLIPASSQLTIPVSYAITNKAVVLYLPSSCSGMVNDAVAGEGEMAVSVMGKIQNGELTVQTKVAYIGKAETTVEKIKYDVKGSLAVSEIKAMHSEPVDIFIKGYFRLESKDPASPLYISDIGYITVYPDGSVADHILDPKNDPDYARPKVYCTEPKE